MATILPVNIGYMCVSDTAKYLSQAHFFNENLRSKVERRFFEAMTSLRQFMHITHLSVSTDVLKKGK